MEVQVEAVYENGVLRPVHRLDLKERQRVNLTISDRTAPSADDWLDHDYMAAIDALEEGPEPTLEEVYRASAGIKGSLSDAVRAERDSRG